MIRQAEQTFSLHQFGRLLLENARQAGMYGLCFMVVCFNLCMFLPANMGTPAAERMINAVQLICFAVIGIVNVWFFYKCEFSKAFYFPGARLAFISLLFIVIGLMLFIYYYISGNNGLIMAFASSGAFLLPFLIYQGWIEFMNIPQKEYTVWYLPAQLPAQELLPLSGTSTMQVQLQIARSVADNSDNTFPVTTSGKLKLGKVFERFIEEERPRGERSIETSDAQGSFGWQFYVVSLAGLLSRNLNPAQTLLENHVRPGARIHVVRIFEYRGQTA